MSDRTIAAISSPHGRGGVALLRLSGAEALPIAEKVFTPKGALPLRETPGGRTRHGSFFADGKLLDDGIVTVFRAPHSYTGEDTVELCCHGGVLITSRLLFALLAAGASPAEPGEFTKRAFLAGKLGLSEAEAVMDLIDAESDEALAIASANMEGALGGAIRRLYDRLSAILSAAYVCGDYPDEDLADLTPGEMATGIRAVKAECEALLATYRHGHAVTEGVRCAIIGKPNAGKSSLLNALLGRDRAIVSAEAGTTRDTVEETVYADGIKLRLIDTAGIRRGEGEVERLGIERSLAAAREAELVLFLFDGSRAADDGDRALLSLMEELTADGKTLLTAVNKSDLPSRFDLSLPDPIPISAKTGDGIDALTRQITALYENDALRDPSLTPVLASARQYAALKKACDCTENALAALAAGRTPDVAGLDLEAAMRALLEVDGRAALDDVVDGIFRRFCVGK